MDTRTTRVPFLLWPFYAIFQLIEWIIRMTGRLVAAVLGLTFMIVGVVLIITIVAIPLGAPLVFFGLILMIRGIF
jgi:hypothetical protein